MKTYYTIYKTTNKINGKFYIGHHKTKNLDDNYMGSGKYLNYSIRKHGVENFDKEILHVFNTPEEMYAKEAELVDEDFIAESNTYNLKIGGFGGWDYVNSENFNNPTHTTEHAKMMRSKSPAFEGRTHSRKFKSDQSTRMKGNKLFADKQHTEETKAIMSAKAKERLKDPTKNSQYGTCWIYNDTTSKKIKKSDLRHYISKGWTRGRKIKF